jgi:hypothetical protein
MLGLLLCALPLIQAVDAKSGQDVDAAITITQKAADPNVVEVEADGSRLRYTVFHGWFRAGALPAQIRLTKLSKDEEHALDEVNQFRAEFALEPLAVDENLTEAARYWAREERTAQRVGHTCAALGRPAGCVEFNQFYHSLPGVPSNWDAGQNAAFDTLATWTAPEALFEAERTGHSERGHFLNLINAQRWIGLGDASIPGYGEYFAMNLM